MPGKRRSALTFGRGRIVNELAVDLIVVSETVYRFVGRCATRIAALRTNRGDTDG